MKKCLDETNLANWENTTFCGRSDSNRIQNHNHLVCKQTLKHLAKLAY